jgi:hypothetical protein
MANRTPLTEKLTLLGAANPSNLPLDNEMEADLYL